MPPFSFPLSVSSVSSCSNHSSPRRRSYINPLRFNSATTLRFVREAAQRAPFQFHMLQSDHGPEFGKWFVSQIQKSHRYTRIGKPNDNAHIERVNRTLQEECLDHETRTPRTYNRALKKYLPYYNEQRLHLGIGLRAPSQLFINCVQGID